MSIACRLGATPPRGPGLSRIDPPPGLSGSTAEGVQLLQTPWAICPTDPPQPVTDPTPPAPPIRHADVQAAAGLRVLLVDDGAHRVGLIQAELARQGCEVVGVLDAATLVHDCVSRLKPDVVIVDSESPTRDTLEHLATLSARNPRPVVVFSEDTATDPMRAALKAGVSAYVVAGLQPERLAPVLQVAIARYEQDAALRAQLDEAQSQLAHRKLIERAKAVLMETHRFDEDEAHRRLRRLAMDRGMKLHEAAERVIDAQSWLRPA